MVHPELLNGGRVTAIDPGLLKQSQCVRLQNAIFRHGDPAAWRIPGRVEYARPAAANGYGLVACRFNNGSHYLLTQVSGLLYRGTVAQSDTMVSASAVSTASTDLSAAQYGNRYFIANGVNSPVTLLSDGSIRQMGMSPVNVSLSTVATATGSFNGEAGGWYSYWITEVYKSTASTEMANEEGAFYLESAYSATPQKVQIPSNLAARAAIVLPTAKVNSIATHWRVYRGGPATQQVDDVFPIGYQVIDDIEITSASYGTTVYDGSSTSTSDTVAATISSTNFNASGGGSATTAAVSATGGAYNYGATGSSEMKLSGFSFGSLLDPINGIKVTVVCSKSASGIQPDMTIDISFDGTTWSSVKQQWTKHWLSSTTAAATGTFGGQNDKWGFSNITQANAGSLYVRFSQSRGVTAPELRVDYVAVTVYHNGAQAPDNPYNAVVIDTADVQGSVSGAGTPPTASILSVYEGMLVGNDISLPNQLRYSQPDRPEYWPSVYFLNLETDENDQINFHGTINNRLVVGQTGGIIRVNYLPTETDADFHRGRAWEWVSRAHGVINKRCATVFTGPDGRQLMAFVSHNGLYATDGYTIQPLSEAVDWFGDIAIGSGDTTSAVKSLVADSSTHTLWLYLSSGIAYIYHYLTQVWTGPCYITPVTTTINAAIAVRGTASKIVHYIVCGNSAGDKGKIYVSDTSDYQYALGGSAYPLLRTSYTQLVVKTRDIHFAGMGNEAQINAIMVYGSDERTALLRAQPLTVSMTIDMHYTNGASVTDQAVDSVGPLGRMTKFPLTNVNADAVAVTVTCTEASGGPARLNAILFDVNPGEEAVVA